MNKRIRELTEQCMVEVKNVPVTGTDGWTALETVRQIDPVKFAELIVQECADICYNRDFAFGSAYGDEICKHFGVKE